MPDNTVFTRNKLFESLNFLFFPKKIFPLNFHEIITVADQWFWLSTQAPMAAQRHSLFAVVRDHLKRVFHRAGFPSCTGESENRVIERYELGDGKYHELS